MIPVIYRAKGFIFLSFRPISLIAGHTIYHLYIQQWARFSSHRNQVERLGKASEMPPDLDLTLSHQRCTRLVYILSLARLLFYVCLLRCNRRLLPKLILTNALGLYLAQFKEKSGSSVLEALNDKSKRNVMDGYPTSKLLDLLLAREIAQVW
ncbi:hypothetical protein B0H10DRAFT_1106344 [Mycena sp. CBHHK59/15]|nr:hypothetical protein B0H10DRAFT_1106344 [Mycena sp. CBHHK59/15]